MYDKVPALIAALGVTAAPILPGPTRDEWAGTIGGLLALVVRELIYWFRNRR